MQEPRFRPMQERTTMAIEPLTTPPQSLPPTRVRATQPVPEAPKAEVSARAGEGERPDREPADVALEAVQAAARVYEQLRANGRELRFASTDVGMRIEVYDGSGRLVRRIPPTEALALATRETTWLA